MKDGKQTYEVNVLVEKDNNFIFIPNMKGKIQSTMGSMSDFYSCDRYSEQNRFICGVNK